LNVSAFSASEVTTLRRYTNLFIIIIIIIIFKKPSDRKYPNFRSCRPPFMLNSHFEGFEDILNPPHKSELVSTASL